MQWYANAGNNCRLRQGSYSVTCCDTRSRQGWAGGYIQIAGKSQKLCKKFTFGAKKKCHTQRFTVARIPTPRPTPRPTPPSGRIDNLRGCIGNMAWGMTWYKVLPRVFKFKHANDGIRGNAIGDGGYDMYDTGNKLYIKYANNGWVGPLSYTQQCGKTGRSGGSWANTGAGDIKYFTCLYKVRHGNGYSSGSSGDVFFAGFKSARKQISGFETRGHTGADNVEGSWIDGDQTPYKWPYGKMWGYRKSLGPKTGHGQDPSNNHLIMVPNRNWNHWWPRNNWPTSGWNRDQRRRRLYTSDPDYHSVNAGSNSGLRVNQLLYVLWGGWNGASSRPTAYRYSRGQIRKVLKQMKPTCGR